MERIVFLVVIALLLLVIITNFIWTVIFGFNMRRAMISLWGVLFNRNVGVDPDGVIDVRRDMLPSEEMRMHAQQVNFDPLGTPTTHQPPKATIMPDRFEVTGTTSDSGWPRPLDEETIRDSRGFRNIQYQTDSERLEQLNPKQDSEQS